MLELRGASAVVPPSYSVYPLPPSLLMAVDSGGSSISIPVGITIGLLASFVQSLGLTIQRKSHVLNQALPEEQRRVEHRRPYVHLLLTFISALIPQ